MKTITMRPPPQRQNTEVARKGMYDKSMCYPRSGEKPSKFMSAFLSSTLLTKLPFH